MELTAAELTLLGLVVEQPRHGYDLEQVIEQRGVRQWTDLGFSSIYYVLTKLERRGLVVGERSGPGRTARLVYRATGEGRRVATASARGFVADGRRSPQPVLVGLANVALLSEDEYAGALRERLTHVEARVAGVREAERAQEPLPRAAREVFSYSLAQLEAERAWLTGRLGDHD